MTTTAPIVSFTSCQIDMSWENTSICRHTCRSISTFLVWSTFTKGYNSLFREIGDIIHRYFFSWGRWLKKYWSWCPNITLMCMHFSSSWTVVKKIKYWLKSLMLFENYFYVKLTQRWHNAWPYPNLVEMVYILHWVVNDLLYYSTFIFIQ